MPERNWIKRFGDVFWETDLRAIEWGLNLLAYWWALALLTPGPLFNRVGYGLLSSLFGSTENAEIRLGCVFLALAVAHTLAPRGRWVHQAVLVIGSWLWGIVSLSAILSWPLPAFGGGYLLVAFAAAWLVARTNVRKRHD